MGPPLAAPDPLDWPARIQEIRARRGWTQDTLAHVIGCCKGAVGQWERGASLPSGVRRAALIALEAETEVLPAIVGPHTVSVPVHGVAPLPAPVTAFKIAKGRCPVCLEYKVASVAMTPGDAGENAAPLCFLCTWLDAILRTPERTLRLLRHQERLSNRVSDSSAS